MKKKRENFEKAKQIFHQRGGMLRMTEAINAGIHRRTLYAMRDTGVLESLGRGLYRLADLPALTSPDFIPVALKVPKGVLCLISALSLHDITTQIPHEVYLALERGAEPPRLEYPPTRYFWFSGQAFSAGIEIRNIDGVGLRVYTIEKTLADCFKYRNKIGLDTAVEALRLYREQKQLRVGELVKYAKICRVESVMRPYLEAVL